MTYLSKTNNSAVKELYTFIIKRENSDSDFWNVAAGNGFGDIIYHHLNNFDDNDWESVALDIINWTEYQRELFTEALLTVEYYSETYSLIEITQIEKRFEFIPVVLKIADTNSEITDNIGEFLTHYLPYVNHSNLRIIESVRQIKMWDDNRCKQNEKFGYSKTKNTEIIEMAYKKVCC